MARHPRRYLQALEDGLGRASPFFRAAEDAMNEYLLEHAATMRAPGNLMEFAPETSSTDEEQLIGRNIGPRDAKDPLFAPAIRAWVD
jgi:hypothetical protein